jgi:hypothetical protein
MNADRILDIDAFRAAVRRTAHPSVAGPEHAIVAAVLADYRPIGAREGFAGIDRTAQAGAILVATRCKPDHVVGFVNLVTVGILTPDPADAAPLAAAVAHLPLRFVTGWVRFGTTHDQDPETAIRRAVLAAESGPLSRARRAASPRVRLSCDR